MHNLKVSRAEVLMESATSSDSDQTIRIAVLLACHNRREITLRSLRALFAQEIPQNMHLSVVLVDDGSDDGTATAVKSTFPQVRLLHGDGSLYWDGGMRMAFAEAMKGRFDHYLWLNDDTLLDDGAIAKVMATYQKLTTSGDSRVIIVGSTRDPDTGRLTYGGLVRASHFHPLKFRMLHPAGHAQRCVTMNGNVVLIPRVVTELAGNISEDFTQSMGDFDYGLRAGKLGCAIWVAPGFVGECRKNSVINTWLDSSLPLRVQVGKTLGVKGLPPAEYRRFACAHGGPFWPLFWLTPYVRVALSRMLR